MFNQRVAAEKAYNKANELRDNGQNANAIAAYTKIAKKFGNSTDADVRDKVAMALVNESGLLKNLGRVDEAIATCDEVARRFAATSCPTLRRQVAMSMVIKAGCLGDNEQLLESISVCDEVISRYSKDELMAVSVADAMMSKSSALGRMGRQDESIAASTKVVHRFGTSSNPEIQVLVDGALRNRMLSLTLSEPTSQAREAQSLLDKASDLAEEGQNKKTLVILRRIIQEFSDQTHPAIRSRVATAMLSILIIMQEEEKSDKEIQACKLLVQKFGDDDEPLIRQTVSFGLMSRAEIQTETEDLKSAVLTYDEIEQRFGNDTFFRMRETVVKAQQNRIIILARLHQYDRAIKECDVFLQKSPDNSADPVLNGNLVWFLSQKGAMLAENGEFERAIEICDEVERRFGGEKDIVCRVSSALSLRMKAGCLRSLGRADEAMVSDMLLISRSVNDPEPKVRWYAENPLLPIGQ